MTNSTDERAVPHVVRYGAAVVVPALAVMALALLWAHADTQQCGRTVCPDAARYLLAIAPAVVLLLGGIGAFVRTYLVWRRGGPWAVWQGAGWFLFVFGVLYASMAAGVLVE